MGGFKKTCNCCRAGVAARCTELANAEAALRTSAGHVSAAQHSKAATVPHQNAERSARVPAYQQ